ncbi:MAG: tetratricopeptide repeat protein [Chromatiales bacterium]|jgi:TolB-like protein/DNA-binding winged helix-turn-helix (wHTH) protein
MEGILSRGEKVVRLEPRSMEVLTYLASRKGEVVTREELEQDVWRGAVVGYDAITNTIIKLRKALGDSARDPQFIATIPKRGYQLIAEVQKPGKSDAKTPPAGETESEPASGFRLSVWLWFAGVTLLVLGIAWLALQESTQEAETDAEQKEPVSIAVLPFDNLENDPGREALVDGITEDIITDLSRLSAMQVLASNATNIYRQRQADARTIGEELSVDYILDGNLRRLGDTLRINVQLIDSATGFNAWAQSYDRNITQLFAIRSEVTAGLIEALSLNPSEQEQSYLAHKSTDNLRAWDLFQSGQRASKIQTEQGNNEAIALYEQAIQQDPAYGRAYGSLAFSQALAFRRHWTDRPMHTLDRALELGERAVELDGTTPQTWWSLGYVHLMRQEFEQAKKAVSRAIEIAPSYADGYGLLALISNNLGEAEMALEYAEKGMQLNPYYTWDYLYNKGRALYLLGRFEEAIESLEKARDRNENAMPVRLWLAASYVRAGLQDDAEWETEQIQMINPGETLVHTRKSVPISDPVVLENLIEDLRKAGLPE